MSLEISGIKSFCKDRLIVDGKKEYSEDTVKVALDAYEKATAAYDAVLAKNPKPYIFKAGDVVRVGKGKGRGKLWLFIQKFGGGLSVISENGQQQCSAASEQEWVNACGCIKIGELKDYLPNDE